MRRKNGETIDALKQTVYADVLLALNFFINYFLLLSVGRIMRAPVSRTRICLGAAFGAACSLTLFLPPVGLAAGCILKMTISSVMVLIAFRLKSVKAFGHTLLVTCAVTFGFGGAMLALWLAFAPRGMVYRNGTVYFSLSPEFVMAVTVACYSIITLAGKICRRLELRGGECRAVIRCEGAVRSLRLLCDSGNLLTEPFSGLPVVIVRRNALGRTLPEGFPEQSGVKFRVIPYSAVGGDGLLCAFRPESVEIRLDRRRQRVECYVAVTDKLEPCDYDGIINPKILE